MKTIAELQAIKEQAKAKLNIREESIGEHIRIVVGMATCGIAAGARPVLNAFAEEIAERKLEHVMVGQTGCIGMCQYEPIVEVFVPNQEKVTYVKMSADKVARVVDEHIIKGNVVTEYTVGAIAK